MDTTIDHFTPLTVSTPRTQPERELPKFAGL